MGSKNSQEYWKKRFEKDKAGQVNRTEDYIRKKQQAYYQKAEEEIRREIEKLYQRFSDEENITLAQAKEKIRGADFKKIDFHAMVQESLKLFRELKGKDQLPGDVVARMEQQHMDLEKKINLYARRGEISYLELKCLDIDRILLGLYDRNQVGIYDHLKSEWEDAYYRQIFNTQQHIGFGKDFIRPNEKAVRRAVLNRYDKKDYSKRLYAHCHTFSQDFRENLTIGLIRGENLDKMAGRIHKRMGVAQSAAKRLVRTETAYVFEQATMEAYRQCGIEWYEFLATLDNKTTPQCQRLDGKHFKVEDARPGENCPPMHPNCRSTTVCWFSGEEEKKARTQRIAKDENGHYYQVSAGLTYKQWEAAYGMREFRYQGEGNLGDTIKRVVNIQKIVLPMSRKVKNVLKDVTIRQGDKNANRYSPSSKTIYFNTNATKDIMEHEIGHAIEETLFDAEKVRSLKQKLTQGLTVKDIRKVKGDDGTGREQDIFVLKNAELIDIYQGRIYAESKEECVDAQGNIDVDKMGEFISVAYRYYMDYPGIMQIRFPEMYQLVKESVE